MILYRSGQDMRSHFANILTVKLPIGIIISRRVRRTYIANIAHIKYTNIAACINTQIALQVAMRGCGNYIFET